MITFEDARQIVAADWPDYDLAPWGYEGDEDWFVLPLPETTGGRIAAVDKESGALNWINENADEYTQERPAGAPHDRNAEEEPTPQAVTWLRPDGRVYKRDDRGRFGSGGGGGTDHHAAIKAAGTAEEVASALETALGDTMGHPVSVSFTGMAAPTAKEHATGVLEAAERFPRAPLGVIDTYGRGGDISSHPAPGSGAAYAVTTTHSTNSRISFNVGMTEAGYRAGLAAAGAAHDLAAATPRGVALHEMGHVVVGHNEDLLRLASLHARYGAGPTSISNYAASDVHEFTAEAFSDVMHNGDKASKLSKDVFGLIEREVTP